MYKVTATIKGLSPLRHNRFIENETGVSKKKSKDEYIADADTRAYKDDGGYYIPKHALKKTIVNGGKKVKIGRGSASAILNAIMIFENDKFYLKQQGHQTYKEAVRIPPKTGARVMQHWIINPEWEIDFDCMILDDVVSENAVKDSIASGGMYFGLLDGRPEFGRYELTKFEIQKV